jgi:hypothetical protein
MTNCGLKLFSAYAVATLLFIGCSKPNPLGRFPLSGSVTLQGQPLDQGTIAFEPVDLTNGIPSGAEIKNGSYDIPTEKGLPAGKYTVRITSTDAPAAAASDAMPGDAPVVMGKERIPPKWNLNSDQQVEIKPDGEHVFDFAIP